MNQHFDRRSLAVAGVCVAAALVLSLAVVASDLVPRRQVADLIGEARGESATPAVTEESGATRDLRGPAPAAVVAAAAWLEANQNPDGSWGSTLPIVESSAAVETLAAVEPGSLALAAGALWLAGAAPANTDYLARQTAALAGVVGFEPQAAAKAGDLLASRNPVELDSGLPNWPEGGWGLLPGFETDSLTTALALSALDRTGFNGGFSVNNVAVAAGTRNVHEWEIPADATKARILITVAGAQVQLCMTEGAPPPFCPSFFILNPGFTYTIVFPDNAPFTPGTNYIAIENPGAVGVTYSMTASYETPTFDTRTLAEPLDYLLQAQNVDGGWGIQRGQATELYTTQHVLLALLGYAQYDVGTAIADGIAHLKALQLGDGSFGYGGPGIPYVTALATLDLIRSENCVFGIETEDAVAALVATQDLDGSWVQEPYDTALAALALFEFGDDLDADGIRDDGDCSGSTEDNPCPDGVTADCDDNCRELSNPLQGNVDNDGRGDPCDCDNANGLVWDRPGEVLLHLTRLDTVGKARVEWLVPTMPGGTGALVYDLLMSTDPADFVGAAVCLESDDSDTSGLDSTPPASGTVRSYLVRAENACPLVGTLGNDWLGTERPGAVCP